MMRKMRKREDKYERKRKKGAIKMTKIAKKGGE